MKFYNFGSMNIDHVYNVENIVKVGQTITTSNYEKLIGGKGLNQSVALAKAGGNVVHLGACNPEGQFLLDYMSQFGIDVSNVKKSEIPTGHAIIQLDQYGNNSIFLYPGANHDITIEYIDEMFKLMTREDVIVLQNEISNLPYIIDKAYELKIPVALNLAPVTPEALQLDFSKISHLILNETEGESLVGVSDPDQIGHKICEKYPNLEVILTLGEKGCLYFNQEHCCQQSIYKANVVDTTAAGDTFTGFYLASRYHQQSIEESLSIASCASSITIQTKGAANSIPTIKQVLARLDELK